jgi:hypothetical protein
VYEYQPRTIIRPAIVDIMHQAVYVHPLRRRSAVLAIRFSVMIHGTS